MSTAAVMGTAEASTNGDTISHHNGDRNGNDKTDQVKIQNDRNNGESNEKISIQQPGTSISATPTGDATPAATERDQVTQSFPPSHILQDGRFIYLPEPTDKERSTFLERSIGRHKLLDNNQDMNEEAPKEDSEASAKGDSTKPKIHPLAVASARLQSNGISELSKAINLTSLVGSGEYFGLSNIINPLLESTSTTTAAEAAATAAAAAKPSDAGDAAEDDAALRAQYLGKRKRSQFMWAHKALERHQNRLAGAVATQQLLDQRLFAIRPEWRLVAPEHGTRAQPHATRPTEVVAIDVHVYDRDRTGRSANTAAGGGANKGQMLARRVPRYATVELPKNYKVQSHVQQWKQNYDVEGDLQNQQQQNHESMKIDDNDGNFDEKKSVVCKTRAEPFAVADPTLGKIDVDFDPEKVPMLSLQLDIEKDSTGYCQSAHLSPLTTLKNENEEDEKLVVALQRSLFCASLFESIRREMIPDEQVDDGTITKATGAAAVAAAKQHNKQHVWLSSAMKENYLPPPSLMVGETRGALSVVHCHEGEVKVQLDSEYALTIKLVEADTTTSALEKGSVNINDDSNSNNDDDAMKVDDKTNEDNITSNNANKSNKSSVDSGSQTPQQLHALCRALLLHAQHVYHEHSIHVRKIVQERQKAAAAAGDGQQPKGLETKRKKDDLPQAHILQECVSLGVKLLLERKIRWALARVQAWLVRRQHQQMQQPIDIQHDEKLAVEWMPLSLFAQTSQFVLTFGASFVLDVTIRQDEIILTRFGENGEYRKVRFHDDKEFELFLKLELSKQLIKKVPNDKR